MIKTENKNNDIEKEEGNNKNRAKEQQKLIFFTNIFLYSWQTLGWTTQARLL